MLSLGESNPALPRSDGSRFRQWQAGILTDILREKLFKVNNVTNIKLIIIKNIYLKYFNSNNKLIFQNYLLNKKLIQFYWLLSTKIKILVSENNGSNEIKIRRKILFEILS